MEKIRMNVSVIRVYCVEIDSDDEEAALDQVREMDIEEIEESGKLVTAETDYIELEDQEEKCFTCSMPQSLCQCNEG